MNDYWSTPYAPVLVIPQVLNEEECGALIQSFVEQESFTVRKPRSGEFEVTIKSRFMNTTDRIE